MVSAPSQLGMQPRPPVVVVLGHVDHGKTSLLDAVRKTEVAAGESGGITQHIGAYQVEDAGKIITFLDTPGHEAFSAIRSRGAKVADVAILVVAADESLKPQTKEAIGLILSANLPFVVAINKIDKAGANAQKVKQDLAQESVLVEDWGGQIPVVEISAKTGQGIGQLLEVVALVAELAELKADPTHLARGVIIESHLDKRRGYVATALVQDGTLHVGDWIVAGHVVGKVKSMEDFRGQAIQEALPAQPTLVTGWLEAAAVGALFQGAPTKKSAEDMAQDFVMPAPAPFDSFRAGDQAVTNDKTVLNIIFKADVASSLEALQTSLGQISHPQVALRILASSIGAIGEGDIKTAAAKGAIIVGFRVGVDATAQKLAERDNISVLTFDIIYELIESVRARLGSLIPHTTERTITGKLRVLAIFKTDKRSVILGGKVTTGTIKKGATIDVVRNDIPTRVGKITNLQQEKEDTDEVGTGVECGMRIDTANFDGTIQEGDILEFVEEKQVQASL